MSYKYLKDIQSPKDLRSLNRSELKILSDELRNHTIEVVTDIGGHLAPTLGVIELTVALHYVYNTPIDKLVWDVGHQAYAHKLLTGRIDNFPTIRQFKGLSGFLKRNESEYDTFGAGHASTSISAALGMAEAREQKNDKNRVVAVIGDGSMTGGLAFEAINNAGNIGKQITVILNDNEMSISPNVGALSKYLTRLISNPFYNKLRDEVWEFTDKLPIAKEKAKSLLSKLDDSLKNIIVPGMLFQEMGFRYFGPIDGHDLDEVISTLDNIKDLDRPVLLHVLTKKGKGMSAAEKDPVKYHGVKPTGINENKVLLKKDLTSPVPSFQDVFGALAIEIARNRKDTVCVTAAMREGTGLVPFAKEFPDRYYDVGIAEGHGVTFSAGLASQNIRPIVAVYSTFLQRAFDHIVHDVAIQHLPVIFCMDRSGLAGEDGPTHHGSLDIAYLRCIQEMIVTTPKDGNEFRNLLYTALSITDKPFSIRYPKSSSINFDLLGQAELLPLGSWEIEKRGKHISILCLGPMVFTALKVSKNFEKIGVSCEVVNCRFIKPMDENYLKTIIENFNKVITIEEGVITGGFGDGVASWLLENNYRGSIKRMGLPDTFVEHGTRNELLNLVGLDEDALSNQINKIIK